MRMGNLRASRATASAANRRKLLIIGKPGISVKPPRRGCFVIIAALSNESEHRVQAASGAAFGRVGVARGLRALGGTPAFGLSSKKMYLQLQQRLLQAVAAYLRAQGVEAPSLVVEQPPRVELGEY